jgi:uncharacterized protein
LNTTSKPHSTRRRLLKQLGLLGAASAVAVENVLCYATAQAEPSRGKLPFMPVIKNRAPLGPNAFYPLPLGSIRPTGWLKDQLQVQANGLSGHLDEFWTDVSARGGWLGGKEIGTGRADPYGSTAGSDPYERVPYYLDGLVALAYLLDDARLKAKVQRFVDWALASQVASGMFGPSTPEDEWWPRIAMLKALCQYQEFTGDARVIPVIDKYLRFQLAEMQRHPSGDLTRYRWQDQLVSIFWLYNRTGSPYLLDLAKCLHTWGHDWTAQFANFQYKERVSFPPTLTADNISAQELKTINEAHGVSIAQGIKVGPLWSLVSGASYDRAAARQMIATLDEYHGLPNGMYSCDEHLAGRNPSQGSELCAVVEYMFSLEQSLAVTGDSALADRLEKLAFNALPGTLTDDMWAHQYDQEPNQVECSLHREPWSTNGPEANLFGLEPNDGCCTANFSQGWPKLTASLFMLTGSEGTDSHDGLVAAVYAPCEVRTRVRGTSVHIVEETSYPFQGSILLTVSPATPTRFPLHLRIPAWAARTSIVINGEPMPPPAPGHFAIVEREWRANDRVEITFPMKPRALRGHHDSVSIERGPLVFSLPITESWVKLRDNGMTADWQVYPASRWNYALNLASDNAVAQLAVTERSVGKVPFSSHDVPVTMRISARQLPTWFAAEGAAKAPPQSPVTSDLPDETITLVPYACAKLRITAFPALSETSS